ncbi:MAG: hypothetical protein ACI8X5_000611 [Planctomycetota bacterium]
MSNARLKQTHTHRVAVLRTVLPTMKQQLLVGLAGAILAASTMAQDGPTLKVGDAAPALNVAEWVKGSQVNSFESGSVYLVEFWATW